MSIYLNKDSMVIVQGMTGSEGIEAHHLDARRRHEHRRRRQPRKAGRR